MFFRAELTLPLRPLLSTVPQKAGGAAKLSANGKIHTHTHMPAKSGWNGFYVAEWSPGRSAEMRAYLVGGL